jgi:hypothetical protein
MAKLDTGLPAPLLHRERRDKILSRGSQYSPPFWIGYQIAEELLSSCSGEESFRDAILYI